MLSQEDFIKDFKSLGLVKGDTVFLRGNIAKLGRMKPRNLFLDSLLAYLGEEGTVVTLGFSKTFPFYAVDKSYLFTKESPSSSGALSKLFMAYSQCQRSTHPSHSFLAIGKNAKDILAGHTPQSLSYSPMQKLIDFKAKMIIFGIVAQSPGFTTVHFAQEQLGLTQKSWFKNFFRVYYDAQGEKKYFKRKDFGGCSAGFAKFYPYYMEKQVLTIGKLVQAEALSIEASRAYEIEHKLLSQNPSFHFCDNALCLSCRVAWKYDKKYLLNFIVLKLLEKIKRVLK